MIPPRWIRPALAALFPLLLIATRAHAQSDPATPPPPPGSRTIILRMIDNKTGQPISSTELLVQVNHQKDYHADWVHLDDNDAAVLTLPADATLISIHAKYDLSLSLYVNCDTQQGRNVTNTGALPDPWYPVAEILSAGTVAPNGCGRSKEVDKMKFTAKPGEFVFFVRKRNWRESSLD